MYQTNDQMVMGQGIRDYISLNPWNYLRRAERLASKERVYFSNVELTDVSFYQKVIDFNKMKAAGIRGTIVRVGQNTWPDSYYEVNWSKSKNSGLPRGSYWLLDSRTSVKAQADLYWSMIKDDIGELMVTADYEESYGGPYGGWRNLYDFTERLLGNGVPLWKLWIYSGYYYWLDHSPQNDPAALAYFNKFKLWIPWYTNNPAYVKIPKPWDANTALLWQNGTPVRGAELGVQTAEIDINQWTGDLASFNTFWELGGTVPPPPPPEENGESMITIQINRVARNTTGGIMTVRLRSTPDAIPTTNILTSSVSSDDLLVCDKETIVSGAKWRKVRTIVRSGLSIALPTSPTGEVWVSDASDGSLQVELASFDVPTVDLANVRVVMKNTPALQFLDDAGNVLVEKSNVFQGELL
jgi:hypothetical protein